jgi:protein-tyrosine kinase
MGKIFDALQKSKKEFKTASATNESPKIVENSQIDSRETSFDIDSSDHKTTMFLNKENDYIKDVKHGEKAIPDAGKKILYTNNNIDKDLVVLLRPKSFESEQFKMLRTNLLFPISGKAPRTIIITSALPGEGKSFVSANLAISIAQSLNEHVLLMDCDIRMPCIHTRFGFNDVPGLSEYLANGISLSSLILKTKINKLSILPGGKPPDNPSELLSSRQMSKLLEEVKERYRDRYIVIDSPPPKLTAETNAILRQVDGILLVIEYG